MRYTADTITDDALDALYARLAAAEAAVRRLDGMATAWVEQLPETIRTATAAEAVQIVTRRVLDPATPEPSGAAPSPQVTGQFTN